MASTMPMSWADAVLICWADKAIVSGKTFLSIGRRYDSVKPLSQKNKDKFVRLLEFFKEVVDICNELNIAPVLSGSLAVFAHTQNQDMNVNDVDLSCSEAEFSRIIGVLTERNISYKLRE